MFCRDRLLFVVMCLLWLIAFVSHLRFYCVMLTFFQMAWWSGTEVTNIKGDKVAVNTLYDCLEKMACVPPRPVDAAMRMPVSGIYKIKGVGDVLAGRVEQGLVKPGEEVIFLPTHTKGTPCEGKVFTVEMHHKRVDEAKPGDNVGLNIKGLNKQNMPRAGDVMIYKKDTTLSQTASFDAQVQILDIPGEIKCGYSPIGFVRCGRAAWYVVVVVVLLSLLFLCFFDEAGMCASPKC